MVLYKKKSIKNKSKINNIKKVKSKRNNIKKVKSKRNNIKKVKSKINNIKKVKSKRNNIKKVFIIKGGTKKSININCKEVSSDPEIKEGDIITIPIGTTLYTGGKQCEYAKEKDLGPWCYQGTNPNKPYNNVVFFSFFPNIAKTYASKAGIVKQTKVIKEIPTISYKIIDDIFVENDEVLECICNKHTDISAILQVDDGGTNIEIAICDPSMYLSDPTII